MKEEIEKFVDGWEGFTKSDLKEIYNTNTAQWPAWITCYSAVGFDPVATLKANGLHPDKIPEALRDHIFAGKIIKKIAECYSLTYVHTPEHILLPDK